MKADLIRTETIDSLSGLWRDRHHLRPEEILSGLIGIRGTDGAIRDILNGIWCDAQSSNSDDGLCDELAMEADCLLSIVSAER